MTILSNIKSATYIVFCMVVAMSCQEKHPGFETKDGIVYTRLIAFGDSGITVQQGQFVHLSLVMETDTNEKVISSIIPVNSLNKVIPNEVLRNDLLSRNAGDMIKYFAPANAIIADDIHRSDSVISVAGNSESEFRFEIHNISVNADSLKNYLQTCAQTGAMEETEAIRNWQIVCDCEEWKEINDLSFAYFHKSEGDSIKAGKEILISYTTHLLGGKLLDQPTEMKFVFGKPGQLIQGFQWGLAKLKEGEHAYIFMPSIWAFGEDGIPDGPVPPRTPVYIDVEVVDVN